MKFALITVTLASLMNSAFALHAYRSDECQLNKLTLSYAGNYPTGGYYVINNGAEEGIKILASTDVGNFDEEEVKTMPQFSVERSKYGKTKILNQDGCFQDQVTKYEQVVAVTKLSQEQESALGIKNGELIPLKCVEKLSCPTGKCQ